jgi:prepilin-type N-terminal cleavage/methylation domain-containing protein
MRTRGAFTLVEMMIVVAMVAILTAVALPALAVFQSRSRGAEVALNYDGIWTAIHARTNDQEWTYGSNIMAPWNPNTYGKTTRPWGTSAPWDSQWKYYLGWAPDGAVRCSYMWQYTAATNGHELDILCDLDGDLGSIAYMGQEQTNPVSSVGSKACLSVSWSKSVSGEGPIWIPDAAPCM